MPVSDDPLGQALVVQLDATHFLVAGMAKRIEFVSTLRDGGVHEVLRVEVIPRPIRPASTCP